MRLEGEVGDWTPGILPRRPRLFALLAGLFTCLACGGEPADRPSSAQALDPARDPPVEHYTGDLAEVRRRGVLRVLVLRSPEGTLPRAGSPQDSERQLATALARELRVDAEIIPVDGLDELIPALLGGRGDLVVDNFTVTDARRQQVAFSSPVTVVREQVVTRADDESLSRAEDLAGRRVAVRPSSSFWESVQKLRTRAPEMEVVAAPERYDTDELLDRVARGDYDVTVADSNLVAAALAWRDDLRVAFDLEGKRIIAWAMRPDAPELRKAVDGFLAKVPVGGSHPERYADDLPGIRERGVLRVLTRNSATTYFIWRGELVGFEYDLAREFAERLGLRLEMVVPPSRDELVNWLHEGRGDVVAAALTASNDREKELRVAFSRNYLGAVETVVVRADEENVSELADLDGREVVVRRSSSYWPTLTKLREAGASFRLVAAPEGLETEQIIARVADGRYDATVADSHIVDVELAWRDDIRKAFQLGDRISHGWAVRPSNRELLAAIDDFFRREYRGLFYNVTLEKYFRNARKVRRRAALRVTRAGQISDYDDLAREYARQYAFDWRLIVAQMHQESRFDPDARSFAGARGLLQVLPRTGSEFGFQRLDDPRTGVHAGVAYMAWLRNRLPPGPSEADRRWLTLASYNVGYGHVRDARRIARQRGWDPDQWFGHVEQAMLLKEDPAVHSRTRFGFARGSEPVHYVRAIRDRYDAYVQVAPPLAAADL